MQGIFVLFIFLSYIGLGLGSPFVFGLGYIWCDLFMPQRVVPNVMGSIQTSLILALGCLISYFLLDRRSPPRITAIFVLTLIWGAWITATTMTAAVPDPAWQKWNWAVKTVVFSAFMPFFFRSRVQMEAVIWTVVLSIFANTIPYALKTMLGGTGYGRELGLIRQNSGLGEGSTLAIDSISCIPFILWLRKHSQIVPRTRWTDLGFVGAIPIAIIGSLGTFARTGLVSLAVWGGQLWWFSTRKILLALGFVVLAGALTPFMGSAWHQRMSTLEDPEKEESAAGRLYVWGWTIQYVRERPLGGGFENWMLDGRTEERPDGKVRVIPAKAYHSIWFEALGEHGYPGLAIFVALVFFFYMGLWRVWRQTRGIAELAWLRELVLALVMSSTIYFAGSTFEGVTFQPLHYYMFALSVAAGQYLLRMKQAAGGRLDADDSRATPGPGLASDRFGPRPAAQIVGWRQAAQVARAQNGVVASAGTGVPGWRERAQAARAQSSVDGGAGTGIPGWRERAQAARAQTTPR